MYRPACRIIQIGGRSTSSPRMARSMSGSSAPARVTTTRPLLLRDDADGARRVFATTDVVSVFVNCVLSIVRASACAYVTRETMGSVHKSIHFCNRFFSSGVGASRWRFANDGGRGECVLEKTSVNTLYLCGGANHRRRRDGGTTNVYAFGSLRRI